MKFSAIIKEKIDNGKSAHALAKEYGVSHTTIYKILNGKMDDPSPLVAARILEMLKMSPAELIDYDPDYYEKNNETIKNKIKELRGKQEDTSIKYNQFLDYVEHQMSFYVSGLSVEFCPYAYDDHFKQNLLAKAYIDSFTGIKLLSFEINPVKIYKGRRPFHDIQDFVNISFMLSTNIGRNNIDRSLKQRMEEIGFQTELIEICTSTDCNNFMFFTTSSIVFEEILEYRFRKNIDWNVQLVWTRNNQLKSSVLAGKEIVDFGQNPFLVTTKV